MEDLEGLPHGSLIFQMDALLSRNHRGRNFALNKAKIAVLNNSEERISTLKIPNSLLLGNFDLIF